MISYGFKKYLGISVEEAEMKVTEALKRNGFGIISRIDISSKLKEKTDTDFRKYIILGACNPQNALKALQVEEDIGLMLPCNVAVYESGNGSNISFIKPTTAMSMIENRALEETAVKVEESMKKAFDETL